jgi:hypothetical protein
VEDIKANLLPLREVATIFKQTVLLEYIPGEMLDGGSHSMMASEAS